MTSRVDHSNIIDVISDRFGIPSEFIVAEKTIAGLGNQSLVSKSRIIVRCCCGRETAVQIASLQRVIRRTGSYRCKPCSLSSNASFRCDPEYKKKQSDGLKRSWTEERRQEQSSISVGLWSDPAFVLRQTASSVEAWSSESRRRAASSLVKSLWATGKYRASYEVMWSDPEYRRQNSERIKQVWSRPEYRAKLDEICTSESYRQKMSDCIKEVWRDDEYRLSVVAGQKRLWEDSEHRQKMAEVRARVANSGVDSGLERVTQRLLTDMDIEWERHPVFGPYEFDLFVPSRNVLIECQGEYWHSLHRSKRNDASKFTYIDEYFPHLQILYLYERDFLNPEIVKRKIQKVLFEEEQVPESIDFDFSDVSIVKLDPNVAQEHSRRSLPEEFLQSYHYASYGRSAKTVYGAFVGGILIAVCKFSHVIRQEVASSMKLTPSSVMELDRFCIHPNYQKRNFASWMISRCSLKIFEEYSNVSCLVAFSDATYGHTGSIYKASNWTELHRVRPDYYYVSEDGFVMHKKTLYGHARSMKKKEREYAEEFGYVKMFGKEKIKFSYRRP